VQRYQLVMVGNPIDGKHLEVVMIVSAWSSVNDVVFGHEKIAAKGNEITIIEEVKTFLTAAMSILMLDVLSMWNYT
jgi:hypothetical protein